MNTVNRRLDNPVPFDVFNDFDNIINGFFRPERVSSKQAENAFSLAVDVIENENTYEIQAELPGIDKDDLNVTLEEGVLTIAAENKAEKSDQSEGKVLRRERRYGNFSRSLKLGKDVDENNIDANYKDGVLTVTLAKAAAVQPKKIAINS